MIKGLGFSHTKFNFPCGELQVQVKNVFDNAVAIFFEYENNEEIIELLLLVDALRRLRVKTIDLHMPYVPYSRQDRVNLQGEALSLSVLCSLINSCGFASVSIFDPHSDVTPALLNNCQITDQLNTFTYILSPLRAKENFIIISPDAGAAKKVYKMAKFLDVLVIQCIKHRDPENGNIWIEVPESDEIDIESSTCVIVDDICDGGATFVQVADQLKILGAPKIILCVTHGFFTKGTDIFKGLIDEIYTRKGKYGFCG